MAGIELPDDAVRAVVRPGIRAQLSRFGQLFRERDRGLGALRRAGRTAIIMPALFAVGSALIGNQVQATFAAFASFALLLLVNFGGPMRDRLQAHLGLAVAGAVLVCVGTWASRDGWLAAVTMAVVGFGVLFAGVVSSVLASSSTSLLLAFILSVSLPGPVSTIPDRLLGWGVAAVVALFAIALLWPSSPRDPLKGPAVAACRALAGQLRSSAACDLVPFDPVEHDRATAAATAAVSALHRAFLATPYRPTSLSTTARTLVRLVDEVNWMGGILGESRSATEAGRATHAGRVVTAAATVLELGAALLESPDTSPVAFRAAGAELETALAEMERSATLDLPVGHAAAAAATQAAAGAATQAAAGAEGRIGEFVTSLEASFRAQELGFAASLVARNIDGTVTAERRGWWARFLGRQPEGLSGSVSSAWARAGAHLERHSVWLHNSLRGAIGLGLAVLVANRTGVQHSFWVIFGTLSVLRSNALNTGQDIVRGVLGTVVGFVLGAAVLAGIGTNTTLLWLLLPVVVLLAGVAPAVISFAAGQAAFTLTLVILFNIGQPAGWRVGLVRVEDVALGCAVSLVVGLLFWPRGAGASLRTALAEAYADGARYLDKAVTLGALACDNAAPVPAAPTVEAIRAAAASRRLDDAFRTYLAERGAKPVPLAEVTSLVTGVAALRLAADAVLDLWQRVDAGAPGDRAAARAALRSGSENIRTWYEELARGIAESRDAPVPQVHDKAADGRLIETVRRDLGSADGPATGVAVRVIWTADHLDAVRRLQRSLVGPAGALGARRELDGVRRFWRHRYL